MNRAPNIFISWSGDRSRLAAEALRDWLPKIIQSARPWMSATDIEKGTRGMDEIGKALEGNNFGICCLTPENLEEPWINFEAGSLAKSLDKGRVWTYLLGGLKPAGIKPPLSVFQATIAEKDDTRKLVLAVNGNVNANDPLDSRNLDELFDLLWPKLDEKLSSIPPTAPGHKQRREVVDMVEEILGLVRAQDLRRERKEAEENWRDQLIEAFARRNEVAGTQLNPWNLISKWAARPPVESNPQPTPPENPSPPDMDENPKT